MKTNRILIAIATLAYWAGLCNAIAFYDPGQQRWLNRDAIGERDGINIYIFVKNKPTCSWDAYGLFEGYPIWGGLEPPEGYLGPNKPSQGNCWRYACGDPKKIGENAGKNPPGWVPGLPGGNDPGGKKSCPELMNNLRKVGAKSTPCLSGYHRIVIQYADDIGSKHGRDFHFSREFPDGTWGDKSGSWCPEKRTGPDDISPGYVKCGELCVPDGWDTDKIPSNPILIY